MGDYRSSQPNDIDTAYAISISRDGNEYLINDTYPPYSAGVSVRCFKNPRTFSVTFNATANGATGTYQTPISAVE